MSYLVGIFGTDGEVSGLVSSLLNDIFGMDGEISGLVLR